MAPFSFLEMKTDSVLILIAMLRVDGTCSLQFPITINTSVDSSTYLSDENLTLKRMCKSINRM